MADGSEHIWRHPLGVEASSPEGVHESLNDRVLKRIPVRDTPEMRRSALKAIARPPGRDIVATTIRNRAPDDLGGLTLDDWVAERVLALGVDLAQAELWWVAEDMLSLLETAAAQMPSQDLMPDDPPTPCPGLVVFERPVESIDSGMDQPMLISGMLWAQHTQLSPTHVPLYGFLAIEAFAAFDAPVGLAFWPVGGSTWRLREPLDHCDEEGSRECASVLEDRRRIAAFWTLIQQEKVVETERRPLSPKAAKRLERAGMPVSDIRIARLRRARREGSSSDAGDASYSHRFVVSGHWRNQWLPSRKAHRLQWIAPYVKGPEDKPLVIKETVKAWVA